MLRALFIYLTLINFLLLFSEISNSEHVSQAVYKLPRERFFCLKLDINTLVEQSSKTSNITTMDWLNNETRFSITFLPLDAPALPIGWNYIVMNKKNLVLLYGFVFPDLGDLFELEFIRLNLLDSSTAKTIVRLIFTGDRVPYREDQLAKVQIKFSFHQIDIMHFLSTNHHIKVDRIVSQFVWPGSKLLSVGSDNLNGTFVIIQNNEIDPSIERLKEEINLATRSGQLKLCQFRKSKSISIEHHFRQIGLYPNWCTFKFVSYIGEVLN